MNAHQVVVSQTGHPGGCFPEQVRLFLSVFCLVAVSWRRVVQRQDEGAGDALDMEGGYALIRLCPGRLDYYRCVGLQAAVAVKY